jgi:hypothetical protein
LNGGRGAINSSPWLIPLIVFALLAAIVGKGRARVLTGCAAVFGYLMWVVGHIGILQRFITLTRACRLAVLFSCLCRLQGAKSSAAAAAPDAQPASLPDALLVSARGVPRVSPLDVPQVLAQGVPPVSLQDVLPVLARAVPRVSQQERGSQVLDAPSVPRRVSLLASHSVFH